MASHTGSVTIVLVAHAPLASALREVALHVYPDLDHRILAVDVPPTASPSDVDSSVLASLKAHAVVDALVLTDVFGATPSNGVQRLQHPGKLRLVAGVNVPMIWRVCGYADDALDRLADRALSGGAHGIMGIEPRAPQFQDLPSHHGQDHRSHQQ